MWAPAGFSRVGVVALAVVVAAGGGVAAADELLEKARREGKAIWYASIPRPIGQAICEAFNKKNLGVECQYMRLGGGAILRRILEEAKAGIYVPDVIHSSNLAHALTLKRSKLLAQYAPKGVGRFPKVFRDPEGYYAILRVGLAVPGYNTRKVEPGEVPRTWKELLKPRWRGKLVMGHPAFSGAMYIMVHALLEKYGWGYFRELAKLSPRFVNQATEVTTFLVTGESWLSVGGLDFDFFTRKRKGDPVDLIFPEDGVPIYLMFNGVAARAPRPHAARVLADFLFSREAQQILVDQGLYVGHPDVKYQKGRKRLDQLDLLSVDPVKLGKEREEVLKQFRAVLGV